MFLTELTKSPVLFIFLLLGFLHYIPLISYAADRNVKEISILLDEEKKELAHLKAKIDKQNRKISYVRKKQTSLFRGLRHINDKIKINGRELKIYKWKIEINKKKVKHLTYKINQSKNVLMKKELELNRWLRVVYKERGVFPVRLLFSANGITDLLQRVRFMNMVTEYDASLFNDYKNKVNRLKNEKESLLKVRTDLSFDQNNAKNKKDEYNKEKTIQRGFLRKLKREKSLGMQIQKELIKASEQLGKIILKQEKKVSAGELFNIIDHKGHLTLPVKGLILNRFGKKRDKRYDSYILYNGINIKIPKNTSIRAIFSGKILYTGYLEGYGNLVIIGHGDKIHSVYGHLNKILCRVGQKVRKTQIIAKSGDTGSILGNSLYFEMRENGKAVDPYSWLRVAKQ